MNDEQTEDELALPPLVYVPCTSAEPTDGELTLEMRQLADGRLALPVYSALDRLVNCCGEGQPWAAVPTNRLDEASASAPFDVIVLDLEIPEELRNDDSTEGGNHV
ncbi:MAG: hypothetical protein GEU98_21500 [Pseudonocardiaceae bacterium]|nr:hypothetical protein [Pseudonocardiaceae bacterium]